jgi:hypothetical protein
MDSWRSNETEWPNNTLLTYTLSADGQGEGERGRCALQDESIRRTHLLTPLGHSAIGRTPSAVAMKLVNFASFDPIQQERGIRGPSRFG